MNTPIQTTCKNCKGRGFISNLDDKKGPVTIKLCRKCKGRGLVDTGAYVEDETA